MLFEGWMVLFIFMVMWNGRRQNKLCCLCGGQNNVDKRVDLIEILENIMTFQSILGVFLERELMQVLMNYINESLMS